MIDGALYLIKTSFLKTVIKSKDQNETFWNGKFTCIENEVPFMDIDTEYDMQKFDFLREYFNRLMLI
jgi:pseudaminic acid cytidylyltransferase